MTNTNILTGLLDTAKNQIARDLLNQQDVQKEMAETVSVLGERENEIKKFIPQCKTYEEKRTAYRLLSIVEQEKSYLENKLENITNQYTARQEGMYGGKARSNELKELMSSIK